MRIVSTVPSATEIVCKLGLYDSLVGVTYCCDYPPEVREKPVVVESLLPRGLSSRQIHEMVSNARLEGKNYFRIRYDLINELKPDLVIFQGICDVCSIPFSQISSDNQLTHTFESLILNGGDLRGIMDDILKVGKATEREEQANILVSKMLSRIETIREMTEGRHTRPKVLFLEWIDPPIVGGHWVPEMIKLIGGEPVISEVESPSFTTSWGDVISENPDIIILGPCGYNLGETIRELRSIEPPDKWFRLDAVKNNKVWIVESNHYFSRPGPRIIHGLEILADIVWGMKTFSDVSYVIPYAPATPWLSRA